MDDGQGFDPINIENCGFGMKTMLERAEKLAGTLTIESDFGNGTIVTLEIPDGKN
jgi:signal transduction histidine kinase